MRIDRGSSESPPKSICKPLPATTKRHTKRCIFVKSKKDRMKFLTLLVCLFIIHFNSIGQITGIKISGDTCSNFTLDLQAEGTSNSPYFFWHFDDPASGINDSVTITGLSPSPFPSHTFTSPGIYNVCVTFQEPNSPVTTICRIISIGLCCDGLITTTDSCLQNNIPFSFITGATINTINWNFGDNASGTNNISNALNPSHQFTSVGTYTVTATIDAICGIFTDTSIISIINCNAEPCTGSIIYNDTCLNGQTSFQVNSSYPILSVIWNFDDPISGTLNTATGNNTTHQFTSSKGFNVSAIVNFNCGVDTLNEDVEIINCEPLNSSSCKLTIPNAFSPNKDNVNDYFLPMTSCPFEKYELFVFNRWGEQIFRSNSLSNSWNGDYKGLECLVGVYNYLIKYKYPNRPNELRKGDITIIR